MFALQHTLSHYKRLFPEYTDHTEQHSMQVIDFCNRLIGSEQIEKLNADEIYVLLMRGMLQNAPMVTPAPAGVPDKWEQDKQTALSMAKITLEDAAAIGRVL